jgi:excisionase family DNA binding protein
VKKRIEDLPDNTMVGTKDAAEYLMCSRQSIRNWIMKGKLSIAEIRPGGNYRILVMELKRFKEASKQSAKEKRR